MAQLAALCLALSVFAANSSQISISAKTDKEKVSLGEPLTLTITISGDFKETPEIEAPKLDDFDIASSARQSSFNLSGGEVKSKTELIYILLPQKEGKLSIGEFNLLYEGKEYKSQAIQIEVGVGKSAPFKEYPPKKLPEKKAPIKSGQGIIL